MREQAAGEEAVRIERHTGWLEWAGRHPGVVLLGALAMAILALNDPPRTESVECDANGEEVPLFI